MKDVNINHGSLKEIKALALFKEWFDFKGTSIKAKSKKI